MDHPRTGGGPSDQYERASRGPTSSSVSLGHSVEEALHSVTEGISSGLCGALDCLPTMVPSEMRTTNPGRHGSEMATSKYDDDSNDSDDQKGTRSSKYCDDAVDVDAKLAWKKTCASTLAAVVAQPKVPLGSSLAHQEDAAAACSDLEAISLPGTDKSRRYEDEEKRFGGSLCKLTLAEHGCSATPSAEGDRDRAKVGHPHLAGERSRGVSFDGAHASSACAPPSGSGPASARVAHYRATGQASFLASAVVEGRAQPYPVAAVPCEERVPGGATTLAWDMHNRFSRTTEAVKIGLMVAGNSGRPGGACGGPMGQARSVHAFHTTQVWLDSFFF